MVQTGAQLATLSPTALYGFMAALSVNLAVLNSLPFPALDGGQLVFVIIEGILGKKLPRKVQDSITAVSFIALFGFGLTTIFGDIQKIFLG